MFLKGRRKGQAAIEFLMTYGWMLLVVLIVGALIFSFVDFGSLLPNKIDLNNNLRGDPTGSLATAKDNLVQVVFKYNGRKRVQIDINNSKIKDELNGECVAIKLTNLDTLDKTTSTYNYATKKYTGKTSVGFLPGKEGLMTFNCSDLNEGGGLNEGDSLVGTISIIVRDSKTKINIPSKGAIRLQVN